MSIGSRLKVIREMKNISQRALAASTNVNRTYIVQLEGGRVQRPGLDKVMALANGLGVPVEMLSNDAIPLHVEVSASDSFVASETAHAQATGTASLDIQVIRAPTAEQIAAEVVKQLRSADEPPDPEHDARLRHPPTVLRFEQRVSAAEAWPVAEEYPTEHSRAHYWEVTVRGDCMASRIENGDLVWVDPSLPAQPGAVVVVYWEGDWTLKRLRRRNGVWLLVPDNPTYEPLEVPSDQLRVLGVVVNVIKGRP